MYEKSTPFLTQQHTPKSITLHGKTSARRSTIENPDVDRLETILVDLPSPVAQPVLVMVSGLPGAGKSHFSHQLIQRVPLTLIQSDVMRKVLFPSPTYTAGESGRLFRACHTLIRRLLQRGIPVLFDATNLVEHHREFLYNIAYQLGVKLVLVYLKAPTELVQQRLRRRVEGVDDARGSTADWQVHQKIRSTVEPMQRNYYVVDTSRDIGPVLTKVVREIRRAVRTAA